MSNYLDSLNPAQKDAVLQKDGPMIIIAGAGSGKTRVLTYRIAHLMQQGVDAFNILSLTFTNKAAREMKERIAGVVGASESKNLWMGTFHSVFARILRSEADKLGFPSNFTIYDTQDSVRLITSIIKEMQLDKDRYKPKQILGRISSLKNSLITVNAYFNNSDLMEDDLHASRPKVGDIYKEYVARCFKSGAMDFDDLLLRTNEVLARFPDVLAKYQDRFRYIMVDEYQDTNHSQYLIVKALADRFQNICVVGDDSQSIYSFRGANISNILNFQKDYPEVNTFKLEQNYRSTKNIVNAANSVIEKNKTRLDKVVWTSNEEGEPIRVINSVSDVEEAKSIINSISDNALNNQLKLSSFLILYRTNSQSRAMEEALRKRGLLYKIFGGLSFFQRKEVKDTLAYLRLIVNKNDEAALKRIINYPRRGIGDSTIDKLTISADYYKKSIFEVIQNLDKVDIKINAGTKNKLQDFINMILRFQIEAQTKNAFELAKTVINNVKIIKDLNSDGAPEAVSKVDNVQELLNGIKSFITERIESGEDDSLVSYLEDVALATDFDSKVKDEEDYVSLMSIHQAKGLEYSYVYIAGLEEGLFPSAMSMNTRSELEEERRLFYVALTRAEKVAYLSYARTRFRWGNHINCEPSRFLKEIDEKYLEYLTPKKPEPSVNRFVDASLFDTPSKTIRFQKPIQRKKQEFKAKKENTFIPPKKLKKVMPDKSGKTNLFDNNLIVGNIVEHQKFGKGEVISLEGRGPDKKALIKFRTAGKRNLLLRFVSLKVIG